MKLLTIYIIVLHWHQNLLTTAALSFSDISLHNVINTDETPLYFNMANDKTIDVLGARDVLTLKKKTHNLLNIWAQL